MTKLKMRWCAFTLAMVTVAGLTGCGSSSGTGTSAGSSGVTEVQTAVEEKAGEEVTGENTAEIENVEYKDKAVVASAVLVSKSDPMTTSDAESKMSYALTHDTLLMYNEDSKAYEPRLCESYSVSDDGITYTFNLRPDATFSNGVACTSQDVVYTFERAKDFSSVSSRVKSIESMECPDEHTVVITLKAPDNTFTSCMANNHLSILSKENIETMGDEGAALGTGAWVLNELVADQYAKYIQNEYYWGERPVTKELEFRKMTENSARVIALQTGEIDVCLDVSTVDSGFVDEDPNLDLVEISTTTEIKLDMNLNGYNEPLQDIRVRQALQHATNKEELMMGLDASGEVTNQAVPPSLYGYSDSVTEYEYDVEKAKALLEEAGYGDGLELSAIYENKYKSIFEILQQQWAKVGVTFTTSTNDSTLFKDYRQAGTFDTVIHIYNWTDTCTGLKNSYRSDGFANYMQIGGPEMDAMIDRAVVETDSEKLVEICEKISEDVMDTAATLPLYISHNLIGQNAKASGAVYYMNGKHEFTYLKVER